MGATKQMSVRMPVEIFSRLELLAEKTGRTPTYYLRESVEEHLDDLEDVYLSEQVLENVRSKQESVLSNEEFWHGLDD